MEQGYTVNKLINLIYGECDLCERLELEHALEHDTNLSAEYRTLMAAYKSLHKVTFRPRSSTIASILNYASNQQSATA